MFSILKPRAVAIAAVAAVSWMTALSSANSAPYQVLLDDFNYATTAAVYTVYRTDVPNWNPEGEAQSDDVGIIRYPNVNGKVNGMMELRDYRPTEVHDADATRQVMLISGLSNIKIGFNYLGHETEADDYLYFQWRVKNGSTWSAWSDPNLNKYSLSPVDTLKPATVNLTGLTTTKDTLIEIMFWTDVTDPVTTCTRNKWGNKTCSTTSPAHDEAAKVDDIWLYALKDYCPPPVPQGRRRFRFALSPPWLHHAVTRSR
jgi:hypothetical protein